MPPAKPRVAVVAAFPVQYIAPFFAHLAARGDLDLTVLYCMRMGLEDSPVSFSNFGHRVVWDIDLLDGYRHRFMRNPVTPDKQRRWTVMAPGLVSELRRDRYDVVVDFGWQYPANWLAVAAARRARLPVLLYTDTDVRDPGGRPLARRLTVGRLVRRAAGALYTGTFNRDFYIRHGMAPERLWFSPWAVDHSRFAGVDPNAERARLHLRDDRVYLLFVGTLIARKNVAALLRAVAALQAEGRPVGLVIAGSGPDADALESQAEELRLADVHWLGFVNQRGLPAVYAAADVFVLPSLRDPRATVVNEAMASGLPVIVSSGTGVWGPGDLVRHGEEGFVADVERPGDLERHCRALLDGEVRRRMGEAARRRVTTRWSYDVAAEGWSRAAHAVTGSLS